MTFRFEKIGPVDSADLTLGDLTIIAGRNNTGKTYLVYALYGFLKQWEAWPSADDFFERHARRLGDPMAVLSVSDIVRMLLASGRATVQVPHRVLAPTRERLVDQLTRDFSAGALSSVFNSASDAFKGARLSVGLDDVNGYSTAKEVRVQGVGRVRLRYIGNQLVVAIEHGSATRARGVPHSLMRDVVCRLLFWWLCPDFPQPFILSAERFGISLFYKELDFTKSQLVDLLQKVGRDNDRDSRSPFLLIDKTTSRYAQPIKDNIDYTRSIYDLQKETSPLANDKMFDDIRNLMEGDYKASRDVISFRSKNRQERRFDIPLHLASSSARGLADLYFYLRHKAARGDLLIIDEPESHLDTGNQILLARILARFVRAGIKVLITTHSDYLIKEINNLIMLGRFGHDKAALGAGYTEMDQLSPSSVRAYVAEGHSLSPATVDDFGIDMPVFDHTIDAINRVSRELAAEVQARLGRE